MSGQMGRKVSSHDMYMFFWGSIPRLPTKSTNNKN
nr:MAG TPA: hypothetical protein [Caudoviricetes sp.]